MGLVLSSVGMAVLVGAVVVFVVVVEADVVVGVVLVGEVVVVVTELVVVVGSTLICPEISVGGGKPNASPNSTRSPKLVQHLRRISIVEEAAGIPGGGSIASRLTFFTGGFLLSSKSSPVPTPISQYFLLTLDFSGVSLTSFVSEEEKR